MLSSLVKIRLRTHNKLLRDVVVSANIKMIYLLLFFINTSLLFSQYSHKCFTANLLNLSASTEVLQKRGIRYSLFPKRSAINSEFQHFFVRNVFDMSKWDELIAKKIYSSAQVVFWIDSSLVKTMFTEQELDSLIESMKKRIRFYTSSLSIDSTKGILELEHQYFGKPPNVDGDGILDILFLDIKDDFVASGSFIAGFFDPNDLVDNTTSNKRDMLYIDVNPLIKNKSTLNFEHASSTIAHEYQHLIHTHYEQHEPETVFINEGLSEYAETFCGFPPRSGESYRFNTTRSLLSWNYNDPLPDYSRASLWTEYLFQRIGKSFIKDLVQSPAVGMQALNELLALSANTFQQIFTDWTLANFLNDKSFPPFYYVHPSRKTFRIETNFTSDKLPSINTIQIPTNSFSIVEHTNVNKLVIEPKEYNKQLSFSALITSADETKDFVKNITENDFSFVATKISSTSIEILIRNTSDAEEKGSEIEFSYLATGKKSGKTTNLIYDDGIADNFSDGARYFLIDSLNAIASIFYHSDNAYLEEISVKGIFLSEVTGNNPNNSERDICYQIFSVKNNLPDSAITEKRHHVFDREFGKISFENISLSEFYSQLNSLKDTFCVVIQNDSDDNNYFAIGLDNSFETKTLLKKSDSLGNTNWKSFADIQINDDTLSHWNAMVRCKSVFTLRTIDKIGINPKLDISLENISISFTSHFVIDTNYSSAVLLTPNGNYFTSVFYDNFNPTLTFKYDGTGLYKLALSLYTKEGFEVFDTLTTFVFAPPNKYIVGNNFPNPFNKITNVPISLYDNCNISLQIYNIMGELVKEKQFGMKTLGNYSFPINMSNFASSVYLLRFIFAYNDAVEENLSKIILVK